MSGTRFPPLGNRRDMAKKAVVTISTLERIETGAENIGSAMPRGWRVQAAREAEV